MGVAIVKSPAGFACSRSMCDMHSSLCSTYRRTVKRHRVRKWLFKHSFVSMIFCIHLTLAFYLYIYVSFSSVVLGAIRSYFSVEPPRRTNSSISCWASNFREIVMNRSSFLPKLFERKPSLFAIL